MEHADHKCSESYIGNLLNGKQWDSISDKMKAAIKKTHKKMFIKTLGYDEPGKQVLVLGGTRRQLDRFRDMFPDTNVRMDKLDELVEQELKRK